MVQLELREASADDAPLVYRLTLTAYEEYRHTLVPPSGVFRESGDDVRVAIAGGGAVIAWLGEEPVGCGRYEIGPDRSHLYFGRLSVLPEHRGRGIASRMVAWFERRSAEIGVPEVRLGYETYAYDERPGYGKVAAMMRKRIAPAADGVSLTRFRPLGNGFAGHAFIDWDDTLAGTMYLYEAAEEKNSRTIGAVLGLDAAAVREKMAEFDVAIARREGLGKHTFPTAHVRCYEYFCAQVGAEPAAAMRESLWRAAEWVYDQPQSLLDGAEATLRWLRENGFEVNVWTGGDADIQQAKIERSGLRPLLDNVFATERKDADALARALGDRPRDRSFVAGNSLHSDIAPALRLGLLAVHVDGPTWGFDHAEVDTSAPHYHRVSSLRDLPALIVRRLIGGRMGA